ncbi:hypothetical protein WR25_27001 [Diploscapter pachys]|uniref:VWFA domain-containing protein n=1 Tax=Diploscapter pachys TaxID=2018661 RepID=A0A2A2L747_9BILA|nr:hypothetical protein WR25_27001 [Diploscapter pachys]
MRSACMEGLIIFSLGKLLLAAAALAAVCLAWDESMATFCTAHDGTDKSECEGAKFYFNTGTDAREAKRLCKQLVPYTQITGSTAGYPTKCSFGSPYICPPYSTQIYRMCYFTSQAKGTYDEAVKECGKKQFSPHVVKQNDARWIVGFFTDDGPFWVGNKGSLYNSDRNANGSYLFSTLYNRLFYGKTRFGDVMVVEKSAKASPLCSAIPMNDPRAAVMDDPLAFVALSNVYYADQNDAYLADTSNLHKPCVSLSPSTMHAAYSINKGAQNSMIDRMKNYNIKYVSVPVHFYDPNSSANDSHPLEKDRINRGTSCNTALSDDSRTVLHKFYPFFTPPFDTSTGRFNPSGKLDQHKMDPELWAPNYPASACADGIRHRVVLDSTANGLVDMPSFFRAPLFCTDKVDTTPYDPSSICSIHAQYDTATASCKCENSYTDFLDTPEGKKVTNQFRRGELCTSCTREMKSVSVELVVDRSGSLGDNCQDIKRFVMRLGCAIITQIQNKLRMGVTFFGYPPLSYDIDSTKIPMQDYGYGSTCDNDWFPRFPDSDWNPESCNGWTPTLKGISEGIRLLNLETTAERKLLFLITDGEPGSDGPNRATPIEDIGAKVYHDFISKPGNKMYGIGIGKSLLVDRMQIILGSNYDKAAMNRYFPVMSFEVS